MQVDMSLKLLKAGKHVLQEKPAAASITELETALSSYNSLYNDQPTQNIWAVAENYRFEPAFVESRKLVSEIGDMMSVQVIIEGSMNSSNPYFSSSWRRNFTGGFILDMGVHYIAGLRMVSFSFHIMSKLKTNVYFASLYPDLPTTQVVCVREFGHQV
nr:NAD(P)-binding Rossmann-fold superfamily protein [Tanacetum cinerariifolium]